MSKQKVKFVDGSGQSFFECNPAEARMAMDMISAEKDIDCLPVDIKKKLMAIGDVIKAIPIEDVKFSILTKDKIADAFAIIENREILVTHVVMSPNQFADIRKWERDICVFETHKPLLKAGVMGVIWGATMFVSTLCPEGTAYVAAQSKDDGVVACVRLVRSEDASELEELLKDYEKEAITEISRTFEKLNGKLQRVFSKT